MQNYIESMIIPNYPVQPNAKAMIDSLSSILMLVPNKDLEQGKDAYISAYGEFDCNGKNVLIRISDHNLIMHTWPTHNIGNDLSLSVNYAITFVDKVKFNRTLHTENKINGPTPTVFTVRQYVYFCNLLSPEEAELVLSACVQLAVNGVFSNPLETDGMRHALILRHITNQLTKDLTSKVRKAHRKKGRLHRI